MNHLPGITRKHCPKPHFLKNVALSVSLVLMMPSRSQFFLIQILKVDQVSFKLITKYLSDVGDISRNQLLFFEKTEQLFIFWDP